MNLKICYIHYAGYPQIGRTSFFEYSQQAASHGLDVHVICTRDSREGVAGRSQNNVNVYEIPVDNTRRRASARFAREAVKIVREVRPDIVHCFHFRGSSLIPLTLRRHEHYSRFILDIRSGHLGTGFKGMMGRWLNYIETFPFDAVAFIAPGIRYNAIGGMPLRKPVFHFPIGVHWKRFARAPRREFDFLVHLPSDAVIGIYAGELARVRDMRPLLCAIAKVMHKAIYFHFLFIGDGPDRHRLMRLAEDLGIQDRVFFPGRLPYSEIPALYHQVHVGVSYVPRIKAFDHQPALKLIEYMAAGLAVVATNTSAQRAVVVNGRDGLLTEDSPDAIAEAFLMLIRDRALRERLGKNAQQTTQQYDWPNIFERFLVPSYHAIGVKQESGQ